MIQTPTQGVKLDFNALNVTNQAKMQLAGEVGQIGRQLGEFSQKLQAAKNYGVALDADRQMRESFADFQLSRQGRTDEENWGQEWKEKAESVRSSVYDEHAVGPELKRQLQQNFNHWQSATGIEVKMLAQKQAINRATIRLADDIKVAAQQGDEEHGMVAISGAVAHGILFPEQGQRMKIAFGNQIDEYAAKNYMDSHPAHAVDFFEEKDKKGNYVNLARLNPDQRKRLITEANAMKHRYQSDNAVDYMKMVDAHEQDHDVPLPSDAELNQAFKDDRINPVGLKEIKSRISGDARKEVRARAAELGTEVALFDPTDASAAKQAAELRTKIQGLDSSFNGKKQLLDYLDRQENKITKHETPVRTEFFRNAERDHTDGLFLPQKVITKNTWHIRGPNDVTRTPRDLTEAEKKAWEKKFPRDVIDEERAHYATYLTKMRAYFDEHPTATDEMAEKYAQVLRRPYVMKAVDALISNQGKDAHPDVTKEEYEALDKGGVYWVGGKRKIKG
jgi:hypothetical protein